MTIKAKRNKDTVILLSAPTKESYILSKEEARALGSEILDIVQEIWDDEPEVPEFVVDKDFDFKNWDKEKHPNIVMRDRYGNIIQTIYTKVKPIIR